MPEVCTIYSGVSFAYHATPLWTCKVWCSYFVYHFFWQLWKVYATSAFVILSLLTETLVYFHLLNLLRDSCFLPCFVLFNFLLPQIPRVPPRVFLHLQVSNLDLNWSAWANIGYPFFLGLPCSVFFLKWTSLSLALPPYFFYTKFSPLWQMTMLLGLEFVCPLMLMGLAFYPHEEPFDNLRVNYGGMPQYSGWKVKMALNPFLLFGPSFPKWRFDWGWNGGVLHGIHSILLNHDS